MDLTGVHRCDRCVQGSPRRGDSRGVEGLPAAGRVFGEFLLRGLHTLAHTI
jgi:hypothetical protein